MKWQQAFKFELLPDGAQRRLMYRFAGSCRFVFNKALALQKERYEQGENNLGYAALCKQLTGWRNGATSWLAESPVHPLQQSLKSLERAYANFFAKRAAFPSFKKKGQSESFRYPDPKQFKLEQCNSRIFLPKLGWLRYHNSRAMMGAPKNVTVSHSCGKWYASIQTEREVPDPVHPSTSTIGIDMGIARFATLSDGTFFAPLNSFKLHEKSLVKAQRVLSRKVKRSNNWRRAKVRVQKIQARIANVRRDFLHKASTISSKNHAVIVIEDLAVKSMSASAAGTIEKPGQNVKQKSGLNRAILDQGWGEFRRQLEYKQAWRGGQLIAVPAQNTSRTCPDCGHMAKENRTTQACFACVRCGYENNADVVGAINVLRAGQARIACQVKGASGPQQQEPTEATVQELARV